MKRLTVLFSFLFILSISFISAQMPVQYRFNLTGLKTAQTNQKRMFTGSGPLNPNEVHLMNIKYYNATISLPAGTMGAWVDIANSNCGWSAANPNNQQKYCNGTYDNTKNRLTVSTYFYQSIGYNTLGQQIPKTTYPFDPTNQQCYVVYYCIRPSGYSLKTTKQDVVHFTPESAITVLDYPDADYINTDESEIVVEPRNTLSIEDETIQTDFRYKIYPNPIKNQINISVPTLYSDKPFKVTIYDFNGKTVKDLTFSGESVSIPFDGVSGQYAILIQNGSYMEVQKIMVSK